MSKKKGGQFEEKVKKCINSGSLWFDKGDLKTEDYLIECKYTEKKGFRITTKILKKLWEESLDRNKLPALVVGIKDENETWILNVQVQKEN
jgi:hypothetical protein